MNPLRLALIALSLAARIAAGQATVVDEGSFTISRGGNRIGREDFSIRHVPTTAGAFETLTRGLVVLGPRRLTVDLSADSIGLPARFQSKTTGEGRTSDTYRAEVVGRRLSARSLRSSGESARELLLPDACLLVEDGVLHLLQFVVARGSGTVQAMVPARGVIVTLTVEDAGADRVSIAFQSIAARKFIVREGGSALVREVWTDARGRLLKVAIPSEQLLGVRDDAPRSPIR
jgi:hypothetical protein